MSDLAADHGNVSNRAGGDAARSALPSSQTPVFFMSLSLGLMIALTIPSSEVREKSFRIGLMAKTAWAHGKL